MKLEDLNNRMISIQVNEPWEWKYGILSGKIIEIQENKLTIELTKSISGNKFTCNKLTVSARYQGESILTLIKKGELTIGGALLMENTDEFDYILIGTLKL